MPIVDFSAAGLRDGVVDGDGNGCSNDKVQAYPTIIAEHANNRHNNNNDKYANNER